MFGSLLPIFAATDAATDRSSDGKQPSGLTVFPGEEPSDEEMRDSPGVTRHKGGSEL